MRVRALVVALVLFPLLSLPAATATPAPQTYIVSFSDDAPTNAPALLESSGVTIDQHFDFVNAATVRMTPRVAEHVASLPYIASVAEDEVPGTYTTSSKAAVGAGRALASAGYDGSGVAVAVVDSGVDGSHPALDDAVTAQFMFSPDGVTRSHGDKTGHGTHVAGIIAGDGSGADGQDVSGIAPGAEIVSLDLSPSFTTSNALRAFEWLHDHHDEHDIRVVTNSWGRERDQAYYDPDDAIVRASNALVADGIVVVFSAGNGGPEPGHMTLEAANPHVITVGATSDTGRLESYSSRGPVLDGDRQADWFKPDLVAPGTHIVSARAGGGPGHWYVMMNGTSMSAPHVAGAAAVLLAIAPDLTPGQVQRIMWETARDVGPQGPDDGTGYGMLDLHAALERVLAARGGATTLVDEWRESGSVSGIGGPSIEQLEAASLDSDGEFTFTVGEGAERASVHLNYTGRGEISVQLRSPSGHAVEHRTSDRTWFTLADPQPGQYTVTISPAGPAEGSYDAHASVLRVQSLDARPLPDPPPRPDASFPASGVAGTISSWVPAQLPPIAALLPIVGLVVAVPCLAVAAWRYRRPC